MKMSFQFLLTVAIVFFTVLSTANAQERGNDEPRVSPNASVSQTIGTTVVSFTYGRPSVNEREVFGALVPYDEVWRAGANEATTITFSDDVTIEGESLSAGTYGLFVIPTENDDWTIILNNTPEQWGAFDYNSDDNALRVSVSPETAAPMEQYMIYFEAVHEGSGKAVLHWSTMKVSFEIEA